MRTVTAKEFNELPHDILDFDIDRLANFSGNDVVPLPLHRHAQLADGEHIVWSLTPIGLTARSSFESPRSLVPCFWYRDGSSELVEYEFADMRTAETLQLQTTEDLSDIICSHLDRLGNDSIYGVQSLCSAYARYLCEAGTPSTTLSANVPMGCPILLVQFNC